jgi:hypothetical protein
MLLIKGKGLKSRKVKTSFIFINSATFNSFTLKVYLKCVNY